MKPRPHSACVVGIALGDEGKGRVIDNLLGLLLKTRGISGVTVVRFQGGSNSGHTVEANGIRLALHQVPSGILNKKSTCIMDRGMSINPADLVDEIRLIEERIERNGDVEHMGRHRTLAVATRNDKHAQVHLVRRLDRDRRSRDHSVVGLVLDRVFVTHE